MTLIRGDGGGDHTVEDLIPKAWDTSQRCCCCCCCCCTSPEEGRKDAAEPWEPESGSSSAAAGAPYPPDPSDGTVGRKQGCGGVGGATGGEGVPRPAPVGRHREEGSNYPHSKGGIGCCLRCWSLGGFPDPCTESKTKKKRKEIKWARN